MRKSAVQTRTRDSRGGLTFGGDVVIDRESRERVCANLRGAGRVRDAGSGAKPLLLPEVRSAAAAVGEINRTDERYPHQDQYGGQQQENDHSSIS